MQPPVNGFRQVPLGFNYEQSLGLSSGLAFAYERSHAYCKPWHTHNRAMVLCPLGAARVALWVRGEAAPRRVTAQELLFVAAGVEHQTAGEDDAYHVLALYPCDATLRRVDLPGQRAASLPRSGWFEALAQQFIAGRVRSATLPSADLAAIEWLLISAAFAPPVRDPAAPPVPGLAALLQAVEADLGAPWSLDRLARSAHMSRASLTRLFRRELGTSPAEYLRQRRMQEAAALLRRGDTSVSEVAERVGYTSQAAFATAFRRSTGQAPSKMRPPSGEAQRSWHGGPAYSAR